MAQMAAIGVIPPNFAFPSPDVDAWVRLSLSAANRVNREGRWLQVVGRLDAVYDRRLQASEHAEAVYRAKIANRKRRAMPIEATSATPTICDIR